MTIDRSDASDAELATQVARFGIFDAEERVELAIVRSLDSDDPNDWMPRALAAAAVAALGESPAEAADVNGCPDRQHHGVDCPGDACRYAAALAPQAGEAGQ